MLPEGERKESDITDLPSILLLTIGSSLLARKDTISARDRIPPI